MKLAVIVIHYGQLNTTKTCLTNLKKKIGAHQLILVNNSLDNIDPLSQIIPGTKLINNKANLGFARAVNQGLSLAMENHHLGGFVLLNNDVQLTYGSFENLANTFLTKPSAGIVSPVLYHHGLYDWGGKFNKWWGTVKHKNFAQKPKTILSVDHVAGAAMLIKRVVVEQIGLFDERFFLYYEDLDYCLRAHGAGFTIHINPEIVAEHAVSASSTPTTRVFSQWRSHIQFFFKYFPKKVYPTAILTDILFYPFIFFKTLLLGR